MYIDLELELDFNDNLDWIFETHGRVSIQSNKKLPQGDNVIKYEHQNNKEAFSKNI